MTAELLGLAMDLMVGAVLSPVFITLYLMLFDN